MSNFEDKTKPYSKAIIRLLKGPVYSQSSVWEDIIHYQREIQHYLNVIGLELILKKKKAWLSLNSLKTMKAIRWD